jgi:uncharacterized protein (TIGR00369 family)
MSNLLEWGQQVLATQPFSKLLDAELVEFVEGRAELHIPVSDKLKQQNGFLHGGVVAYAADNALTYAGGSVFGGAVLTSEFKINYLRPAVGERLIARASVLHAGKTQAVCRCEVFMVSGGEEKLCAAAQGTIVKVAAP